MSDPTEKRALTEDGHGGQKYVLSGPEVLTKAEQVRVIGEAGGGAGGGIAWVDYGVHGF